MTTAMKMVVAAGLLFVPTIASALGVFDGYKREVINHELLSLEQECTASGIAPEKCRAMKECVVDSMLFANKRYAALFVLMGNSVLIDKVNGKKIDHFTIKMFDPKRPEYRKIYLKWKNAVAPSEGNMDEEVNEYVSFISACAQRNGFAISDRFTFLPNATR